MTSSKCGAFAIMVALTASCPIQAGAKDCAPGKERNQDTAGLCCWPGQAAAEGRCVGVPTSCPSGFVVAGDACVIPACEEGKVRAADKVHCCWPGQGYSGGQGRCVGAPRCPPAFVARGSEDCETAKSAADRIEEERRLEARAKCLNACSNGSEPGIKECKQGVEQEARRAQRMCLDGIERRGDWDNLSKCDKTFKFVWDPGMLDCDDKCESRCYSQ